MPPPIPLLLTPGPLTTSDATKRAMLRDWSARDDEFIALNRKICERLAALVGGDVTHVVVPMPGSGTLAVEAMLGSLVPRQGKAVILVNGVYGRRMATMCEYSGRAHRVAETPEHLAIDPAIVDALLVADPSITHVAMVDCETTSGVLNPLRAIAAVVAARGRCLLVDSMSAFGAVPIDANEIPFDALAASPAKCLEGIPGMSFVIARKSALARCSGNAPALNLDLYDQWQFMEREGRWRFTPPTHVMAALWRALEQLESEGGVRGREARYRRNISILIEGLRAIGLETLLPDELQGPVIVTVYSPADPNFTYREFYRRLRDEGYIIAPGKFSGADTFRIACIGCVGDSEIRGVLAAIRRTLASMGVSNFRKVA